MGSNSSDADMFIDGHRSLIGTSVNTTLTKTTGTSNESLYPEPMDIQKPIYDSSVINRLRALEISVIFEDLVDTMTAISNAIPAPCVEIRTTESILEDEYYNRPRYGGELKKLLKYTSPPLPKTKFTRATCKPLLPPIFGGPEIQATKSKKNSRSPTGTLQSRKASSSQEGEKTSKASTDHYERRESKNSLGQKGNESDGEVQASLTAALAANTFSKGILQESTSKRTSSSDQQPDSMRQLEVFAECSAQLSVGDDQFGDGNVMEGWQLRQFYTSKTGKRTWQSNKETPKQNLEDMIKSANLKKNNKHHKLQADIGQIKFMMADIFNELVQNGTWKFLDEHLENQKEELFRLSKSYKRLSEKRLYSKILKAEIHDTKMSKMKKLNTLKMLERTIEDESQEVKMRTEMEAVYTQNYVNAKIQGSLKKALASEILETEKTRLVEVEMMEDMVHADMRSYLNLKIERVSKLLEYWTEKYEVDKERLVADLEELKQEREKTAVHRKNLEAKIVLWTPILKDNRRTEKIKQDIEAYLQKCAKSVTKIAARWRGYMVRAGIGKFINPNGSDD